MPPLTPLLRPDRFFAHRRVRGAHAVVLAVLHLLALPLGIWGVGQVLRARIDGTVMVDNPNRPSERFCEGAPTSMGLNCDAPAEVERNIDSVLSEAVGEFVGPAFVGIFLVLLLIGGGLHAASWLFDGENGIAASFAVALWGLVPSLISLLVGLGLLFVLIDPVTVVPGDDPAMLTARVRADLAPLVRWQPLLAGITTLWSGVIWRFGLRHERGLSSGEATGVAGAAALLVWLLSLA